MIVQVWGYKFGEKVLGVLQFYFFEFYQMEQMGWKFDVFFDIMLVWDKKCVVIECMEG